MRILSNEQNTKRSKKKINYITDYIACYHKKILRMLTLSIV